MPELVNRPDQSRPTSKIAYRQRYLIDPAMRLEHGFFLGSKEMKDIHGVAVGS
ncbi:MAG: hypothetical protein RLY14_1533 [Planctomycetota bacterium]|jgi:hypothetical protein